MFAITKLKRLAARYRARREIACQMAWFAERIAEARAAHKPVRPIEAARH